MKSKVGKLDADKLVSVDLSKLCDVVTKMYIMLKSNILKILQNIK